MKTLRFALLSICIISVVACQQAPKADKAKVADAKQVSTSTDNSRLSNYKVDEGESRIVFTGTKPTGQHKGYFNLDGGSISMVKNEIKGGNFSINIPSLTVVDAMPVEMANNLKGHLLSEDFFKAEKFPVATFNITAVSPLEKGADVALPGATHNIEGNLRLLETTKSISFPAVVKLSQESMKATANFNINRADFGMVYGNDKSLGDKFINPVVNLEIRLLAKKQG